MRVLAAIANYGTGSRPFLDRLIAEYHSMPWDVDVVVLSNIPKTIGPRVEVRVGLPDKNPWSLPFAHRSLFEERRDDYDLFIYSEDDTLVRAASLEAFLDASRVLGPDRIPGFMRTETDPAGNIFVSTMHSCFRWVTSEVIICEGEFFAQFTNDHAACCLITRDQLTRAIDSGGFLVTPHEGRYDMLCTAATDIYTRCGLKRYVCISNLTPFLLPHLPNKYIGRMGLSLQEVMAQIEALIQIGTTTNSWRGPLFDVETGLKHGEGSKNLYESPDPDLLDLIPTTARRLVSVGCGWGETEAALAARGIDVTAIPVDPVFGDALRRRGIQTVEGSLTDAVGRLEAESFDCVLFADVLHLVDDPVAWLTTLRRVLKKKTGSVVLSVPNTGDVIARIKGSTVASVFARSDGRPRLQPTGLRRVRTWLRAASFAPAEVRSVLSPKRELAVKATLGTLRTILAQRFIVRASVR